MPRLFFALWLATCSACTAIGGEKLDISADLAAVLAQRYPHNVDQLQLLERQVQRVAAQAISATVEIEVGHSIGSGVVVSESGLVLTAAHVLGAHHRPATVVLSDGQRLKGVTLGAHHFLDIGMVQIKNPPPHLAFAPAAPLHEIALGEWVVATGQPGGKLDDRAPPVRLGRVLASGAHWICTDCALVGGDSGGPLFNMHGEVVAIHMSIGPKVVHNFHVPINEFHAFWGELVMGKVWGSPQPDEHIGGTVLLGIVVRTVENGCLVIRVLPGFPAAEAGIEPGDVIMSIDDVPTDSMEALIREVTTKEPDATIVCAVDHGGEKLEVKVTLGSMRKKQPSSPDGALDKEGHHSSSEEKH